MKGTYDRQNLLIVAAVGTSWLTVLALASRLDAHWWPVAALLLVFIGLPFDGLVHESFHRSLHRDPRWNDRLGIFVVWLFPGSFTLFRESHLRHHRYNRTRHEMFDLYDEGDSLLLKVSHWYAILLGLYGYSIPVLSLATAVAPAFVQRGLIARARTTEPVFGSGYLDKHVIRSVRLEVIGGAAFWTVAWWLLDLRLLPVALLFVVFFITWSTRQYVGHAFTRRDVVEGALDLETALGPFMLFRNLELTHHRQPSARWQELPALREPSRERLGFWRQYLLQWRGPRPNVEPAPEPLPDDQPQRR